MRFFCVAVKLTSCFPCLRARLCALSWSDSSTLLSLTSSEYLVATVSAEMRSSSAARAARLARFDDSFVSRSARFERPEATRCCLSICRRVCRASLRQTLSACARPDSWRECVCVE